MLCTVRKKIFCPGPTRAAKTKQDFWAELLYLFWRCVSCNQIVYHQSRKCLLVYSTYWQVWPGLRLPGVSGFTAGQPIRYAIYALNAINNFQKICELRSVQLSGKRPCTSARNYKPLNKVKCVVHLKNISKVGLVERAVRLMSLFPANWKYVENSLWLYISTTNLFGKPSMKHRKARQYYIILNNIDVTCWNWK